MKDALADTPSKPFRIPNGIKFIKIDRNTGRYPNAFTKSNDIILEAFKEGQYLIDEFKQEEEGDMEFDNMGLY